MEERELRLLSLAPSFIKHDKLRARLVAHPLAGLRLLLVLGLPGGAVIVVLVARLPTWLTFPRLRLQETFGMPTTLSLYTKGAASVPQRTT